MILFTWINNHELKVEITIWEVERQINTSTIQYE